MKARVLIADDDPVQRRLLDAALEKLGYERLLAEDGEAALAALAANDGAISAVLLDLGMPRLGGLDVLSAMQERGLAVPVIVQTAQGSIDTAVAAMRLGAFDFVVKPVAPAKLAAALGNALKMERLSSSLAKASPNPESGGLERLARSPRMEEIIRLARKAAGTDMPVLIEGESGVGKEVLARAIAKAGARADRPFVTVNCGAIPENLVESILFGHEKGAFTGASERQQGKFVEADGGTLFLDEVGELPLDAQVKLLRAVQEGEVDPVGARQSVKVDIRLISATNRDLIGQVRAGSFREDLYYRLEVLPITVPPLRERTDEIAALIRTFIAQAREKAATKVADVSDDALRLLVAYPWPGNIRQLQNAVFRACVLSDGRTLGAHDFPQIAPERAAATDDAAAPGRGTSEDIRPKGYLRGLDDDGEVRRLCDLEADMILMAIELYGGRLSEVARRLGIGRSTLYRKLRDLGVDPDAGRTAKLAS